MSNAVGLPASRGPHAAVDAVVVGAGPNGLAAAITLAQAGRRVLVLEAADSPGGGARTAQLTLPGFHHDVCSAVHPLGVGSPFFRSLPLREHGLEWIFPPLALAHPFDNGSVASIDISLSGTAMRMGSDGFIYYRLMSPVVASWDKLEGDLLGPIGIPHNPRAMARFGMRAALPASVVARLFRFPQARGLFAGIAAHSFQPLEFPFTAAIGMVLGGLAHVYGWPIPRGGSQRIIDAMVSYLKSLGGEVLTGARVSHVDELPSGALKLLDVTPAQVLELAGSQLPEDYASRLRRFRYGPGAFKVDWALDGPIPWKNRECARAGTVHLGSTLEEIELSERDAWNGVVSDRPYVLVAQQSLFDASRAPEGKHTAWAYCHVPSGCTADMTSRIEDQIERFAPGFRSRILERHVMPPAAFEAYNANYIGGDIAGGATDGRQMFARPVRGANPYATPVPGLLLCSASTPPGAGVHGMCGYHAARAALAQQRRA